MAVGIAVLASNGVAGVWGAVAWLRKDPSIWFWYLLRVAQVTVVLQAVLGFVLFARGMRAPDGLHVAYGVAPLIIAFVSEGMRLGVAQRELEGVILNVEPDSPSDRVALAEMGVMTIGLLMILTLALRAYQTGS